MSRFFEFKPSWLLQILFVIVGFLVVFEYRKTGGRHQGEMAVQEVLSPNSRNSDAPQRNPKPLPEAAEPGPIKLEAAVICLDVQDGKPVLAKAVFTRNTDYLFCHTTVSGPNGGFVVYHRWIHRGEQVAEYRLIGDGRNSKLWSKKEMSYKKAGDWQVQIVDENGVQLGSVEFVLN